MKDNAKTMTFGQLKELLPSTQGKKLPTAKALSAEEILFKAHENDADIIVFKNGFFVYLKPDDQGKIRNTVYAVDRCRRMTFIHGCSKEEHEEGWEFPGCETSYRIINGQLCRVNTVPESAYTDCPWWLPIGFICDDRLDHNTDSRMQYRTEFYFDGDEDEWNPDLVVQPLFEQQMQEEEEREYREGLRQIMREGLDSLTDAQRQAVTLYYSEPNMTEAKVAAMMGINQSTAHFHISRGLKNLKKFAAKYQ